jgi:ribosomal protein S18 acetylase RimI-like enzyme
MKIRKLLPSDIPLITSTWLKTYRAKSSWIKKIMEGCYFSEHNHLINRHVMTADVYVICDPEDDEHVFGYLVGLNRQKCDTIHYIYIKQAFRGKGLAKALLDAFQKRTEMYNTHETMPNHLLNHLKKRYARVIYNPYPFFNPDFYSEEL